MNELVELLDELQKKAKADSILREKLLQTRKNPNPIHAFCEICHAYGVSIYEMDLAMAGEEFYAEIKRSTNGGGENSPALEGEDDFYVPSPAQRCLSRLASPPAFPFRENHVHCDGSGGILTLPVPRSVRKGGGAADQVRPQREPCPNIRKT